MHGTLQPPEWSGTVQSENQIGVGGSSSSDEPGVNFRLDTQMKGTRKRKSPWGDLILRQTANEEASLMQRKCGAQAAAAECRSRTSPPIPDT